MISPAHLVRRMMHTKRWGIINTNRTQTVAEHTAGVAILADQIAITRGLSESDHLALLRHCLYHDAFEVVTGDFPGSIKRNNPALKAALDSAERSCTDIPQVQIEHDLKRIAKAADLAESVIYLQDAAAGSRALAVAEALRKLVSDEYAFILKETNKLSDDEDLGNY